MNVKKNAEAQVKRNTTNYPPDTHKQFCERCYKHNNGCPMTGSKYRSSNCSV